MSAGKLYQRSSSTRLEGDAGILRGGVGRELGGEQAVVGGGGEQQQGGVQQLRHPKQQARQAGPAIPSHPPVPRPDCSTHPATGG